ncbi:MAG: hypothetical protein ABFC84_18840 [Veillonellales bacterium]
MSEQIPAPDSIAAILPCYSSTGDATTIITTDGQSRTNATKVHTVIRRIALSRSTDLIALKQHVTRTTQRVILTPLPLSPGLVLCPVKVRRPRIAGDTSTGYVNYHAVNNVQKCSNPPFQSAITLAGGTEIPVLWARATVIRQLQHARLAISDTPAPTGITLRESQADYGELIPLIHKLIDIACHFLASKNRR